MAGLISRIMGFFSPKSGTADRDVAEMYSKLRSMVLSVKPVDLDIALKTPDEVWGVVMETGYPEAVATLVALADGAVSLYLSNGGGTIGAGEHEGPREVAHSFIAKSQLFLSQMKPTSTYPLAKTSYTRFYLLTGNGVMTAEAMEDDLGNGRHSLSPLFHKGHELITEIRLIDQGLRASKGDANSD